jgi:two-component system alkaline phosphatase synthesis response regulator PhoP
MQILVVDDDPYIQRALSFVLRKEGFEVETASDGQEALSKAKEFKPKIMFLDLMIPKMNGFETCRTIKADSQLKDTYIIILTAKGQEVDKERGLREGADEYMTKPFSPKEIVAKVKSIFENLT